MLAFRSFSTAASPGAAIRFSLRTARSFTMAQSKIAELVCPLSRDE